MVKLLLDLSEIKKVSIINVFTGFRMTMDVLAPQLWRSYAISIPELPQPTTKTSFDLYFEPDL